MQPGRDDEGWEDDGPLPDLPPDEVPEDPDPIDALDELIRAERGHNALEGQRALCVLQLLRETSPVGPISAREQVAAEIGPALGLGSGAAITLVDVSVALRDRLPATLRAVCAGSVSWYKATILAEAVAPLSDFQARLVEDLVLPKAAERTPAQHRDAVRRAVARVDPDGADARRKQQEKTVRLVREHHGDGMGELFARMPSEQLDTVWTAADLWARARKADGDPRTLDQLRVAALVQWAQSYLHHGDPTYCDRWCAPGSHGHPDTTTTGDSGDHTDDSGDDEPDSDDGDGDPGPGDNGPDDDQPDGDGPSDEAEPVTDDAPSDEAEPGTDEPSSDEAVPVTDEAPASSPPTRHGRPAAVHAIWDLTSLLGLTRHCGELTDSGATLPPDAMAELVAGGVTIRRMLIHPATGHLLDLTPRSWRLARTHPTELDAPVVLGVVLDTTVWQAIRDGSADPQLLEAIAAAPAAVRDLLTHPWTADDLDTTPAAYPTPTRLAEFIGLRDRHPTNPTAGPTAASAGDHDHITPAGHGGATTRANLTSPTRRWHNLKTRGRWTVHPHHNGWVWTSPRGRSYYTQPYDYRLGP